MPGLDGIFDKDGFLNKLGLGVPSVATGNPAIDMVMSMLLMGSGLAPRPGKGQSVMDAYMLRERTLKLYEIQREAFSNQMIAQKLGGIDPHSGWGGMTSMFLGSPDGLVNNPIMRAFNGGNPIKAQMALMANMTGMTQYMATGKIGDASIRDTSNVMQGATEALYNMGVTKQEDYNNYAQKKSDEAMKYINADPERRKRFEPYIKSKEPGGEEYIDLKEHAFTKAEEQASKIVKEGVGKVEKAMLVDLKKLTKIEEQTANMEAKVGKLNAQSVNFEATRGFELQDLTKTYTMARDLGMTNTKNHYAEALAENYKTAYHDMGVAPDKATDDQKARAKAWAENAAAVDESKQYFKNTPKVLRAVSDMTGADTAEEAMAALNNLTTMSGIDENGRMFRHSSKMDLGKDSDATYFTDLVRRSKATARVAGISMDAMLQIIQLGKAAAAQNPDTAGVGALGSWENTLKVFQNAQHTMGAIGAAGVRQAGGPTQVMQDLQDLHQSNLSEPTTQELFALLGHANSAGYNEEKKNKLMNLIQERLKPGGRLQGPSGRLQFYNEYSEISGNSIQSTLNIAHSSLAAEAGQILEENAKKDGKRYLGIAEGDGGVADALEQRMAQYIQQNGGVEYKDENGKVITDLKEMVDKGINPTIAKGLREGKTMPTIITEQNLNNAWTYATNGATGSRNKNALLNVSQRALQSDPRWKEEQEMITSMSDSQAIMDERTSKDQATLSADFFTSMIQEFNKGTWGDKSERWKQSIAIPEAQKRVKDIFDAMSNVKDDNTAANRTALFWENRGGTKGDIKKNLLAQGYTDKEADGIIEQRKAYTKEGEDALNKMGAAGLTMNQMERIYDEPTSTFAVDKLKETKVSLADVQLAVTHGRLTGLFTPETKAVYGRDAFGEETQRKIGIDQAYRNEAMIQNRFGLKKIYDRTEAGLDTMLAVGLNRKAPDGKLGEISKEYQQYKEYAIKAGELNKDGSFKGRSEDIYKAESNLLNGVYGKYYGSGSLDKDALLKDLSSGKSNDLLSELNNQGLVKLDKEGKMIAGSLDEEGLTKKYYQRKAHDALQQSSLSPIKNEIASIIQATTLSKAGVKAIQDATGTGTADNISKMESMMEKWDKTMMSSSSNLETAIQAVAAAINAAIKG